MVTPDFAASEESSVRSRIQVGQELRRLGWGCRCGRARGERAGDRAVVRQHAGQELVSAPWTG